jgi:hypothetical protein
MSEPRTELATVQFEGLDLSNSAEVMQREVLRFLGAHGTAELNGILQRFEQGIADIQRRIDSLRLTERDLPRYGAEVSGTGNRSEAQALVTEVQTRQEVLNCFREQVQLVPVNQQIFLRNFEARAGVIAHRLLTVSRQVVLAEFRHYGNMGLVQDLANAIAGNYIELDLRHVANWPRRQANFSVLRNVSLERRRSFATMRAGQPTLGTRDVWRTRVRYGALNKILTNSGCAMNPDSRF